LPASELSAANDRLKQELEVKQHSLRLLQQRISSSESAQMADAMAATQEELEQAKQAAHTAQQRKADMVTAAKVSLPAILQHPAMQLQAVWPMAGSCTCL